jgi:hypothetical protein
MWKSPHSSLFSGLIEKREHATTGEMSAFQACTNRLKATQPLVPPKPKEFEMATRKGRSTALFGV